MEGNGKNSRLQGCDTVSLGKQFFGVSKNWNIFISLSSCTATTKREIRTWVLVTYGITIYHWRSTNYSLIDTSERSLQKGTPTWGTRISQTMILQAHLRAYVFCGNCLSLKSGGAYASVNTVLRVQIESIYGYAAMVIISCGKHKTE